MDIGTILGVFIAWPFLALVPAVLFAAMYFRCRRRVVMFAALAWLVYFLYEQDMKLHCPGECNIRVDLLLFYPVLLLLSLGAIVACVKAWRTQGKTG